jgi:PhnB protein
MQINPYLNFQGNTEEAFNFYKSVFGGEFEGGIMRFKDAPADPNQKISADEQNKVMHIALKIGDSMLMGTDCLTSYNQTVNFGNQTSLCINPPTKEEADRIFAALSEGGKVDMPMSEMFWGDYFGSFTDKFGILWMISTNLKK